MLKNSKGTLKVFLCYASADRSFAQTLYSHLSKDGIDVWLDEVKLLPGQDWEAEIRKAVREADIVIVCHSKQFNQAGRQQKEVRWALDTAMERPEDEIFIIPARLEECDILESLRKWQPVDLFDKLGYSLLMRALYARAEKIGMALQPEKESPIVPPPNRPAVKKPEPKVVAPPTPSPVLPSLPKWNVKTIIEIIAAVATILTAIFGLPWSKWFVSTIDGPTATATNTLVIETETFTSPQVGSPKIMKFWVAIGDKQLSPVQPGSTISVPLDSTLKIEPLISGSNLGISYKWETCIPNDKIPRSEPQYVVVVSGADCVRLFITSNSGMDEASFNVDIQ